MTKGDLYFIKDSFYTKYWESNLKPNKVDSNGIVHNRPCYYAFEENGIMWMVPVSSRIAKYERIYKKKVQQGKPCDTIVFGYVKGNKNAFLIQNMIPVKAEHISNVYMDRVTNAPVQLSSKLKKELNQKVRKVLRLTRNHNAKIVFTNILDIEKKLLMD